MTANDAGSTASAAIGDAHPWKDLIEYLDNVPPDPDHRRRDYRRGAILLAIAASMVVQSVTGVWDGPYEFFDIDVTSTDVALAAIIPAVTAIGFFISARFVRYQDIT